MMEISSLCGDSINKLMDFFAEKIGYSSSSLKKYATNFSWQISEYFFGLLASFIVGIAVARYLGPEMFGIIALSIAIYGIGIIIVSLGVDEIAMRDMIQYPEKAPAIQGSILYIRVITAVIVYISFLIYFFMKYEGYALYSLLIINFGLFFNPLSVFTYVFLNNAKGKYISISRIISYLISSLLKIIFIIIKAPLPYFAFAVFMDYALLYISIVIMYKIKGYDLKGWKIDFTYLKNIAPICIPLFIVAMIWVLYQKISIVMISNMYSTYEVGIYSAAIRLTEIWYLVPAILLVALYPAIVNASLNNKKEYKARLQKLFNLTTLPFIFLAIITSILSPFIIKIIYGDKYLASSVILAISIWVIPFVSFFLITYKFFVLENRIKELFIRVIFGLILLIFMNFILGKYYSLIGYCLSLVFSSLVAFFLLDIFFQSSRELFFMKVRSIFFIFKFIKKTNRT